MGAEVKINIEVFRANAEKLRGSLSQLESKMNVNKALGQTNISPFTDDVEKFAEALQLIKRYKQLIEVDVGILKETGEAMKENDEQLACQYVHSTTGSQPLPY
ncbi:TIGR04197 family type VII secretion effector [Halalkalibacter sp. APA_J-10(15)]|uniref:TIGR04197 family type VII secretion effector n=1 Tax=unclassified Halalkalibacter TaxID=2893063 RepID=UPI001FF6531B|nr:TIGR04197 family type VII secretion effector [Halalkalibacter sp. APA_J-10(15)]MCK0473462.1 TIGR04197 family type VII secretion effector [Halalkalibacter sp. APA_J-10(15)]